eukprot:g746.t1
MLVGWVKKGRMKKALIPLLLLVNVSGRVLRATMKPIEKPSLEPESAVPVPEKYFTRYRYSPGDQMFGFGSPHTERPSLMDHLYGTHHRNGFLFVGKRNIPLVIDALLKPETIFLDEILCVHHYITHGLEKLEKSMRCKDRSLYRIQEAITSKYSGDERIDKTAEFIQMYDLKANLLEDSFFYSREGNPKGKKKRSPRLPSVELNNILIKFFRSHKKQTYRSIVHKFGTNCGTYENECWRKKSKATVQFFANPPSVVFIPGLPGSETRLTPEQIGFIVFAVGPTLASQMECVFNKCKHKPNPDPMYSAKDMITFGELRQAYRVYKDIGREKFHERVKFFYSFEKKRTDVDKDDRTDEKQVRTPFARNRQWEAEEVVETTGWIQDNAPWEPLHSKILNENLPWNPTELSEKYKTSDLHDETSEEGIIITRITYKMGFFATVPPQNLNENHWKVIKFVTNLGEKASELLHLEKKENIGLGLVFDEIPATSGSTDVQFQLSETPVAYSKMGLYYPEIRKGCLLIEIKKDDKVDFQIVERADVDNLVKDQFEKKIFNEFTLKWKCSESITT